MRKKSVLKFIRNGKFLKGCAALSATVLVGVLSFQRQLPDLPGSVPVGTVVTLEEEDTPLAATPVTTTDKKVKKKVTKKKVKLKKAAKKNETKDLGTKRKTKTKTTKSGSTTTKTTILTETHKKEQYKKGKKVKTVTTTITTTTTIQKTTMPSSTSDSESSDSGVSFDSGDSGNSGSEGTGTDVPAVPTSAPDPTTAPVAAGGTLSEAQLRESARNFNSEYPLVLDSFIARGCTCVIDPSAGFTGLFDASARKLTLRENDETIYHELGHFVALGARRLDTSPAFKQIYERECGGFPGSGKIYAASSAGEYFAESMREYMVSSERRAALESKCPSTANAIKTALSYFQDSTIDATNRYIKMYTKQ